MDKYKGQLKKPYLRILLGELIPHGDRILFIRTAVFKIVRKADGSPVNTLRRKMHDLFHMFEEEERAKALENLEANKLAGKKYSNYYEAWCASNENEDPFIPSPAVVAGYMRLSSSLAL